MTPERRVESGSLQWAVAAACLLGLTCALAIVAMRHSVYVGIDAPARPQVEPPDMRLDLNTASAAQLEALPRLGPALAARIAEDRELNGPFASLEDLHRINGIGERTIELIAPHVVVRAPAEP